MMNSRKSGNSNVVANKIRYYREKNNLSYQKLSDQLMLYRNWYSQTSYL